MAAERIFHGIPFDANEIITPEGESSYDYIYYSKDLATWLATYFKNGILVPGGALITTQLKVEKSNDEELLINPGNIVINGRTGFLPKSYKLAVVPETSGNNRIDRVVVELNLNETVNEFRFVLLKGTASTTPSAPELTRDEDAKIYQMSLAQVIVKSTGIFSITDERSNDDLCGISQVLIGVRVPAPVTGDSADNISYDNSTTGMSAVTVQDVIDELYEGKENKPTYVDYTLSASLWSSSDGTYSLESIYPHTLYNIGVLTSSEMTKDQAVAYGKAMIVGNKSTNVLKALGDIPTANIPVILEVTERW